MVSSMALTISELKSRARAALESFAAVAAKGQVSVNTPATTVGARFQAASAMK